MIAIIRLQWKRVTANIGRIIVYFIVPIILFGLGNLISFGDGVTPPAIGILDLDQTAVARLYVDEFDDLSNGTRDAEDQVPIRSGNREELEDAIAGGELDYAVFIPEGFTDGLLAGKPLRIELAAIQGEQITFTGQLLVDQLTDNFMNLIRSAEALGSSPDADALAETYRDVFANGLVFEQIRLETGKQQGMRYGSGFALMMLAFNSFGYANLLLEDRQRGTLARIRTASSRRFSIIFGTAAIGAIVTVLNIVGMILLNELVFDVSASPLVYLMLFLGAMVFLFMAMFFALTVRRGNVLSTLQTIIVVPTSMISGTYWPVDFMPEYMQQLAMLTPQYWVVDAITELTEGSGIASLSWNFVVLFAFILLFVVLVAVRLKQMEQSEQFI